MARVLVPYFALALHAQLSQVQGLMDGVRLRTPAFANSNVAAGCVSWRLKRRVSLARLSNGRASKKLAYFGEVSAGSPPQAFTVIFDTGSGNVILPGSTCSSAACQTHGMYNVSKSLAPRRVMCDGTHSSSDSVDADDGVKVMFGTGQVYGQCYQDQICLGSVCTQVMFIASTAESSLPFSAFAFDGILGLGLPSLALSPEFSLMEMMKVSKAIRDPIVSVFLSDSDDEPSEITFGQVKQEHMDGDLFWVNVSGDSGYWQVPIKDIAVSNVEVGICPNCNVAIDTGTSQLAGPSDVIDELKALLDLSTDCSNYDTLPELGFVLGDKVLKLLPSDYVDKGSHSCELALMELDVPPPQGPLFVLGIPFLHKFFTVYDWAANRVGFATAKHSGARRSLAHLKS